MLWLCIALAVVGMAVWATIFHYVLWPKFREYKLTAGLYDKVDRFEGGAGARIMLRVKGARVMIVGAGTSAIPVLGPLLAQLNGANWAAVFPTDKAATVAFVLTILIAIGPIVMVILHAFGMSDAARTVPVAVDPASPTLSVATATAEPATPSA